VPRGDASASPPSALADAFERPEHDAGVCLGELVDVRLTVVLLGLFKGESH
jgi:hypothetical protein